MPYFSIVIPVYNVEPYLRECLDSLLSQTFIDWEAICVDDGSTDGSGAILDEYAAKDKRFRVVHQKNSGVSVARNVGIELSDSKWIGFLDPDDALDFRWLEIAAQGTILEVDVVRMEPTFWSDGMVQPKVSYKCSKIIIEGHEAVSLWGWRIMTKSGWAWASFWSRRLIDAVKPRFPVGIKYSEDSLFNLSCIGMVKRVAYIPFYGSCYRMRTSSACNSNRDVDERIAFYEAYQEILNRLMKL